MNICNSGTVPWLKISQCHWILYIVLRSLQKYLIRIETSPLPVNSASMTTYRVTPAVTQSLGFCDFTEGRPLFCLFFIPLESFSLIWRRHHCRWRAANFDLCSALMIIKQLGFFGVLHLLWHAAPIYNGHFRGPVTLTPVLPSVWQWRCHYLF